MTSRSALIIATDSYRDVAFTKLQAPSHDADALATVLEDPEIGDFSVNILVNQPSHRISRKVEEFFIDRSPDDLLLLYFSCHGVKDARGRLYFAAENTELHFPGSTGVLASFVREQMDNTRSRCILLLLDCCYSGAFPRGVQPKADFKVNDRQEFGEGCAVITASDAIQYSFEGSSISGGLSQPSVFTSIVTQGLASGEADLDGDGLVSVEDLYEYTYEKSQNLKVSQTPMLFVNDRQGTLFIARNPHAKPAPTSTLLSTELAKAVTSVIVEERLVAVGTLGQMLKDADQSVALAAKKELEHLAHDASPSISEAATESLEMYFTELSDAALAAALPGSDAIWLESPNEYPSIPPAYRRIFLYVGRHELLQQVLAVIALSIFIVFTLILSRSIPGSGSAFKPPPPSGASSIKPPLGIVILEDNFSNRKNNWINNTLPENDLKGESTARYKFGGSYLIRSESGRMYMSSPAKSGINPRTGGIRMSVTVLSNTGLGSFGFFCGSNATDKSDGDNWFVMNVSRAGVGTVSKMDGKKKQFVELAQSNSSTMLAGSNKLETVCALNKAKTAIRLVLWLNGAAIADVTHRVSKPLKGYFGLEVGAASKPEEVVFDNFAAYALQPGEMG